jgi:ACS family pantothenate transporter-like MFS transporter
MLPSNATRIGGIASFDYDIRSQSTVSLAESEPIPNSVTLSNGEVVHGIDRVILATGYHCSFPFLPQLHRDDLRPEDADETCLVTDGTQMHNLYLDLFYIPSPSLVFIGVPYFTATFTLFEFQAIAVAKIFAGIAELPSTAEMLQEYQDRVKAKGVGKAFHSLLGKGREVAYVNTLVELVNRGISGRGVVEKEKMVGHSEKWHAARAAFERRFEAVPWAARKAE